MTGPKSTALTSSLSASACMSTSQRTPPESRPLVHSVQNGWLGLGSVVSSQGQWSGSGLGSGSQGQGQGQG